MKPVLTEVALNHKFLPVIRLVTQTVLVLLGLLHQMCPPNQAVKRVAAISIINLFLWEELIGRRDEDDDGCREMIALVQIFDARRFSKETLSGSFL